MELRLFGWMPFCSEELKEKDDSILEADKFLSCHLQVVEYLESKVVSNRLLYASGSAGRREMDEVSRKYGVICFGTVPEILAKSGWTTDSPTHNL